MPQSLAQPTGRPAPSVRRTLITVGVAGFVAATSFFGAAAPAAAVTADESCTGTVSGQIGDKVFVAGAAVKEIVRAAAKEKATGADLLLVWPNKLADDIEKAGELHVGVVPNAASGSVKGTAVGTAVAEELEGKAGLGSRPQRTLDHIAERVAEECGLTVKASNYVPPTSSTRAASEPARSSDSASSTPRKSSPSTTQDDNTASVPATTVNPEELILGTGGARAPRRDYNGIPFIKPGDFTVDRDTALRYSTVPGLSEDFGVLGSTPTERTGVDNAGHAEALAANPANQPVQLPMLLAVIALAGASAGLVRTWILRRV